MDLIRTNAGLVRNVAHVTLSKNKFFSASLVDRFLKCLDHRLATSDEEEHLFVRQVAMVKAEIACLDEELREVLDRKHTVLVKIQKEEKSLKMDVEKISKQRSTLDTITKEELENMRDHYASEALSAEAQKWGRWAAVEKAQEALQQLREENTKVEEELRRRRHILVSDLKNSVAEYDQAMWNRHYQIEKIIEEAKTEEEALKDLKLRLNAVEGQYQEIMQERARREEERRKAEIDILKKQESARRIQATWRGFVTRKMILLLKRKRTGKKRGGKRSDGAEEKGKGKKKTRGKETRSPAKEK